MCCANSSAVRGSDKVGFGSKSGHSLPVLRDLHYLCEKYQLQAEQNLLQGPTLAIHVINIMEGFDLCTSYLGVCGGTIKESTQKKQNSEVDS